MGLLNGVFDEVNRRGKTFITRLKTDVNAKSRSGSTKLAASIKGGGRIEGTKIVWEGTANSYWEFYDQGVAGSGKFSKGQKDKTLKKNTGKFKFKGRNINQDAVKRFAGNVNKGVRFVIGRSIATRGLQQTLAFTNAIKEFKTDLDLGNIIATEITKEIK